MATSAPQSVVSSIPTVSGANHHSDPTKPRNEANVPFRDLILSSSYFRIAGIENHDALSWTDSLRKIEGAAWFIERLEARNLQKYQGFTTDGTVRKNLYHYAEDEGAPTVETQTAAELLLGILDENEKGSVQFDSVEQDEFRLWSNPEIYVNPGGLRIDEYREDIQSAVHSVLKASLSTEGYEKVLGCCLTNGFLGQLVNGKKVLNEHSYNFRLFGVPSVSKPWGYTFFGHHLCLAVVFDGKRMVIGPTFLGAEPDLIDEGPHAGLHLFRTEELVSLKLMQSLSPDLQERATLCKGMNALSLPKDRWNPFDERQLGGARQDNRVVPFEGCPVSNFSEAQQQLVIDLFRAFNEYYPPAVLSHRVAQFVEHLDETYFAWIGEFGDDDPYYYRIHSPVAYMELDFHCGIFLTNTTPAKCHIHTINRLPNRGDYGKALLEQVASSFGGELDTI